MSAPGNLIAVVGPTAVGKTALAIALAQRFDGEIVNADSRQVYTGMDVGTAKPTAAEQRGARHHLIDIRPPDAPISLGEYLPLAREAIASIADSGKLPVLCGGSGQYVWALLEGWSVPKVPPDPEFRARLERRLSTDGSSALWQELRQLDPERAATIDPQNPRRVIRALEIVNATGSRVAAGKSVAPPYRSLVLGLTADRAALYGRTDARFDAMMAQGLLYEARRLDAAGHSLGSGALSGVGYTELGQYLAGEMTLDEAVDRSKTRTHRLVRRQYTWFKPGDPRIVWLDATHGLPVSEAVSLVRRFLEPQNPCDTIGA
ncbi:MAG: tRNA (adenosine(37)-N6)-dimethylallyltransferase MiaA [Chloroflexota bacterium]|nr:tRNA (adenosine(37)-N6)-dimethylallyltransferase MiaA [Chloroflexota bacterium]MDE2961924.1 tRNA (adenosine(37)-N6)-dimethylallyltransferase MiaA [Chloroflexota bacterium]